MFEMFKKYKGLLIKETLILNLIRGVCAGFAFIILALISGQNLDMFYLLFLFPILLPLMVFVLFLIQELLSVVKLGGIFGVLGMFFVLPGDPLFYLLYKIKPEWVRVKKLKIFNFHPYIFLYEEKYYEQNLKNEIENNKFKLFK